MAARKPAPAAHQKSLAHQAVKAAATPARPPGAPARKLAIARKPLVDKALRQEVVIRAERAARPTGAQRIAPDHSPRAAVVRVKAAKPLAATSALTSAGGDLQRRVEQFLYAQSEMLDNKLWQSFIDLFADDGVYWMPSSPEQTDWEGEPSIFAEDTPMMRVRMGRVTHPNAWSQAPLWMTNHLVSNVVIDSDTAREVVVRSRFHMMELRRDNVRHFGGTYRHTLVKQGQGFAIRMQRVDLFNGQAPFDYVLQIWV